MIKENINHPSHYGGEHNLYESTKQLFDLDEILQFQLEHNIQIIQG